LTRDGVVLADAECKEFDAIILATGFRPDLRQLIADVEGVFDRHGMPLVTGQTTKAPGLYFCGQITSPTGQLREIGLEAQRIAISARSHMATHHGFPAR
jgi:pyruvate/2-oxoglutarate dehydrogenase complex dihydrolipoamide dehydrogenase (E3) component